ncbi:hypothetical protein BDA99DRAFT_534037 [Phascolomyces articulosus]|uniref:Uncharacterized protein n=1 Tax=Phascolomyces articulosus TaxID=60185 RepID=A0AAD5KHQ0_9FUNG|nr:hypothetical protein BDA99DRAFT_534037 [Phascolomyces articulosus]
MHIINQQSFGLARWLPLFSKCPHHNVSIIYLSQHFLNFIETAAYYELRIHTLSTQNLTISNRHTRDFLIALAQLHISRVVLDSPLSIQQINDTLPLWLCPNFTLTYLEIRSFNTTLRRAGQFHNAVIDFVLYVRDFFPNLETFTFAPNNPLRSPFEAAFMEQQLFHIANLHY